MRIFEIPRRVWINQPSNLQPLHQYHAKTCIAWTNPKNAKTSVYFTEGDVYSIPVLNTNCLETLNSQANIFKFSN
ncbi:hypothetical protein PANI_CDS0016 [Maribacter phage Panino]